ncbi:hypothetical protein [Cellulomonas endophytica]|uniref:hypothetical protein n=1 Tax=Cellulomonas endophytica TaxID=2494735 RepID=UPI0010111AA4|nr:hypothetical protein [Cellulomonas endophytica]
METTARTLVVLLVLWPLVVLALRGTRWDPVDRHRARRGRTRTRTPGPAAAHHRPARSVGRVPGIPAVPAAAPAGTAPEAVPPGVPVQRTAASALAATGAGRTTT